MRSSVKVTFEPSFAATNPGNEVPAPSYKEVECTNKFSNQDVIVIIMFLGLLPNFKRGGKQVVVR